MRAKEQDLVVGGSPRVDLLPPSIREAQKTKAIARSLIAAVIVVAALVLAVTGFAFVRALTSQAALDAERNRTTELLAQQMEFSEARTVARQISDARIALVLGTATEIDWRAYLDEVNATLPPGVTLTTVTVDSVSPADALPTVETPLQEDWVATLTISATSLTVPDVESWLDQLENLTGFAGVAPPVNVSGSPDVGYIVGIQVNVNDEAYTLRFQAEEEQE